jgi:DNA-binding HxlR family transcriptional regulator
MDQFHPSPGQRHPSDADLLRIVFQGKWRLRVLREIVKGPVRLSQLRRAVPESSKKVLIDTLHGLEGLGGIERQEFPTKLRRVEYSLTESCEHDVRRAVAIASSEADGQRSRQS